MASTNKTSNLELSQFIATDTPTWLVDYNGDMEKIDAGVGRVEELAKTASTQAVGVANGLQTTNQTVTTLSGQVANVQNQANTTTASVNGINQRLGNVDISGIGDGTITGAISMLNSNLNVRYNKDTDMVQIYYNGAWKDWKQGGLQKYVMVENGTPKVTFENPNTSASGTVQQINGEWVVTSNGGGFRQIAKVDLTNKTTVTANMRATIGSGGSVDLLVSTLDTPLTDKNNCR